MKNNYLKITYLFIFLLISALNSYSATFIVDNLADTDNLAAYTAGDGNNTLRKCIRLANANANSPTVDIISFASVPGVGPFILVAATPYQFISDPVYIDGFTAPGSVLPTPMVAIKGSGAAAAPSPLTNAFNFTAGGSNSTIRGFAIYRTANDGVYLNAATNVTIEGCWIGLTETGALPGTAQSKIGGHGIYLTGASNNCKIGTTTARNVISGTSAHGVVVVGCSGVIFKNNYVGTNTTGTAAIANTFHGINIDNSPSAVIGGGAANEGNLISGNTQSGIIITNASSNAVIKGNKIGTNLAGTAAIANGESGINIFTNVLNTIIGGNGQTAESNLISGNALNGINVDNLSTGTVIKGNKIGTNLAGTAAIGNLLHGIYLQNSNNATIGGGTKADRNIISGNGNAAGENGIGIVNSNGHTVQGNFFGLSASGLAAIPNFDTGLSMTNCSGNTIGGASYMQRNVCSGNLIFGMYLFNIDNTTITGNYVGTDSTGNAALPNLVHGVHGEGGCDLITWTANVISGNGSGASGNGLDLLGMTNNTFYGNYIGLGINGTTVVGNLKIGFRFGASSTGNTIGGTGAGQRNYMSGNGDHGIMFDGQSTSNIIKSNYVGSDVTGMIPKPNNGIGFLLLDGASSNTIGGTGAGEGNLFCCSATSDGLRTQISSNNTIYGNLIGTDKTGAIAAGFGNALHGVYLMSYQYLTQANNANIIGGLAAGKANIITNNGGDGVRLAAYNNPNATTNFNPIIGNKIYCNGGVGINMENNNAWENEGVAAPVVTSSTTNSISGTGANGNTIHVYRNQYTDGARCDCEGEIYVGSTVVAGGVWTLAHGLGLTAAQALAVTATQTNAANSTSEFWVCSSPLPVDMLSLEAKRNGNIVDVNFVVTEEKDINIYHILRSTDGVNFEMIGSVIPKNEPGITAYLFEDLNPLNGISYYRIQTVENDGRVAHSKIVQTNNASTVATFLYPNPATDEVTVVASSIVSRIELHNALGQLILERDIAATEITISLAELSTGVYFIKVFEGEQAKIYKLEKR
jgi:hypothetical protein